MHEIKYLLQSRFLCSLFLGMSFFGSISAAPEGKKERAFPKLDLHPLTEPGFYEKDGKKFERGLYAGGGNEMPEEHRKAGEEIAKSLVPLNDKGEPDPQNGNIVAIAIGHSNCRECFEAIEKLLPEKQKDGVINPKFRVVNNGHNGRQCLEWLTTLKNKERILAAKQAQIAFLMTTYHPAGRPRDGSGPYVGILKLPFEEKMLKMKADVTTMIQELTAQCPNLKMIYIGAESWRGYKNLEPEVYEEGFAYKWLIDDQIKGAPELAFKGSNRKAAWLGWGGYLWEANAPKERFRDGAHASEIGMAFVTGRWMDALGSDSTTRPWMFVKPVENKK